MDGDADRVDELSGVYEETLSDTDDPFVGETRPASEIRPESDPLKISSSSSATEPAAYTILEVETDEEREVEEEDGVVSVVGEAIDKDYSYAVEEPMTDGRLTEVTLNYSISK
jgi:hypothetical protein